MAENIFDIGKGNTYRDGIAEALSAAQKALAAVCDSSSSAEESLDALVALTASIQFAYDMLCEVLTCAMEEYHNA